LCGFGEADEDAVVDLQEAEELEDLAWFGGNLGDTVGWKVVSADQIGEKKRNTTNPLIRMTKTSFGCSST